MGVATMDLSFTPEQEAWRREVRDFLDRELPSKYEFQTDYEERDEYWDFAVQFTKKVGARGWIGLTWPKEVGGQARPPIDSAIMVDEFDYRAAPLVNAIGHGLAGGTILKFGSPEQKRRFIPGILQTETIWVEGLTEPNAGSDLASLETRAVRDGDDWLINGQKTFTTWGHRGDVMYLAARTNPHAPKHKGITIFCLDMKQRGVTLQPLFNLGGGRQNHVFFDNVRVPGDMVIGEEDHGWYCIMNSFYGRGGGSMGGRVRRMFDKMVKFCQETQRNGRPLSKDPVVRMQLTELALTVECMKLLGWEGLSRAEHGGPEEFGGSMASVISKDSSPRFAQTCMEILGPLGQLQGGPWAPLAGEVDKFYRQSFGNHAGGTPQIKRVVAATRGLGLPR